MSAAETMSCGRRTGMEAMSPYPQEDHWREDRTCSFCGSAHPDDVLEAIEAGAKLTPTDKNYKIYIDLPSKSHANAYFQHFDEAQKRRLIAMVNAGTINFAEPGHFYTLPFFISVMETKGDG